MRLFKFMAVLLLVLLPVITAEEQKKTTFDEVSAKADAAFKEKDFASALKYSKKMAELAPGNAYVWYQLAYVHGLMDNSAGVVANMSRAMELGLDYGREAPPVIEKYLKDNSDSNFKSLLAKMRKPVLSSEVAITIPQNDLVPEGIAYDPDDENFYMGSIYRKKILKISRDGKVTDFVSENEDGLLEVLGVRVDPKRRVLWAATKVGDEPTIPEKMKGWTALYKYDLKSEKLLSKHVLHEKGVTHFFNDLTVDSRGNVYVTDTMFSAVYTLRNGKDEFELFVKDPAFVYLNGITIGPDDNTLYLSSSGSGVYKIDVPTKKMRFLSAPEGVSHAGIDGMYYYKGSLVCVQNGLKRISRLYLDKTGTKIEKLEVLEKRNPHFIIPTTGAIVGDEFWYIANSQLRALKPDGTLIPEDQRKNIVILKTKLK